MTYRIDLNVCLNNIWYANLEYTPCNAPKNEISCTSHGTLVGSCVTRVTKTLSHDIGDPSPRPDQVLPEVGVVKDPFFLTIENMSSLSESQSGQPSSGTRKLWCLIDGESDPFNVSCQTDT